MQPGRNDASSQRPVALNFRVPLELRRHLRIIAAERGVTMTSLMLGILHTVIESEPSAPHKERLSDGGVLRPP